MCSVATVKVATFSVQSVQFSPYIYAKVAVCKNSGSNASALLSLVVTAVGVPRRNTDAVNVLLE